MKTGRISVSPRETKREGALFAKEILKRRGIKPVVITLEGELGAGKTTFVKGFARELGLKHTITSPTFLIVRHYTLRGDLEHLFHIDAYRLKNAKETRALHLKNILSMPRSVTLIEWPERIRAALPRNAVRVFLRHGKKEHERALYVAAPKKGK